ncbi:hypothetical protein K1T73_09220 [Roseovarius sp. SCSIO 43702]|uniref:hypothetical protein n=1 Tax=Roseovarius sp. SCSIO 43702 TaxID=2823043 RepID=UPI001C732321|nr:hypothetical protein [Roseovarius sp. SCSIO 43702]QYX55300.1 hypothetical protein K1T73_09220 [Roseovarius sp. SCSIO 43702]
MRRLLAICFLVLPLLGHAQAMAAMEPAPRAGIEMPADDGMACCDEARDGHVTAGCGAILLPATGHGMTGPIFAGARIFRIGGWPEGGRATAPPVPPPWC